MKTGFLHFRDRIGSDNKFITKTRLTNYTAHRHTGEGKKESDF